MKTTDFINDVTDHELDHEVAMAVSDTYTAAKYAIDLHKMLKKVSEQEGIEGWVSEKITLANDYLRTVYEYLLGEEHQDKDTELKIFSLEHAERRYEELLSEEQIEIQRQNAERNAELEMSKTGQPPEYISRDMNETTSAGVATTMGVGSGPKVGSLFGGSYSQKPKKSAKKESILKRPNV